jgi:HPt (histidine-containing phosphotransfer) domain-containing protein
VIGGAKERAFSFGCDAFLGKPLVIREFEEILETYLVEQNSVENDLKSEEFKQGCIDFKMLKEELMLDDEEIKLLLQTFVAKMKKSFPLLGRAIEEEDYEKISLEAHSIKGSAANFRFERLERLAGAIERSARNESKEIDYRESLEEMEEIMGDLMA